MSTIQIAIIKIKEEEFTFRNEELAKFDEKKLSISFNLGFDWNLEDELFFVNLIIYYKYKVKNSEMELVKFATKTGFHVIGLCEILEVTGKQKFKLEDFFMMTFVSNAVSSSRGMLALKLSGTYLANSYLPLVDPKSFIDKAKTNSSIDSPKKRQKKLVEKTIKKVSPKKRITRN